MLRIALPNVIRDFPRIDIVRLTCSLHLATHGRGQTVACTYNKLNLITTDSKDIEGLYIVLD